MRLRDQLRRLRREASQDVVVIRQRDGSVKAFDEMTVAKHLFIAQLNRAGGRPESTGPVADALADAPESEREHVEGLLTSGGLFFEGIEDHDPSEIEDLSE